MYHFTFKKLVAIILSLLTIISISSYTITASASNSDYSSYTEPSGPDYAFWNGKKMVKHSGTTKSNVQWMQAMFNWLREKGYFSFDGSYLAIDGSFGPASKKACLAFQKKSGLTADGSCGPKTIQTMKDKRNEILRNEKQTKNANKTSNNGTITTEQIKAILQKYGYRDGRYWTHYGADTNKTINDNLYASDNPAKTRTRNNNKTWRSFKFNNAWECHGFALYVMSKVTGSSVSTPGAKVSGRGWKQYYSVSELKVGDIIRTKSGHTTVVLTKNGTRHTFVEAWGSVNSKIRVGIAVNGNSNCYTLNGIKNKYGISYILRYEG